MTQPTRQLAVSVQEAAAMTGLSRSALYRLISTGQLPTFTIGARRLIRVETLAAWLQAREAEATEAGGGGGPAMNALRPPTSAAGGRGGGDGDEIRRDRTASPAAGQGRFFVGAGDRRAAALAYARQLQWTVIPLYQVRSDGTCACREGAHCRSAGKHPRLDDWQTLPRPEPEQVATWWQRWPAANVGVVLGAVSGGLVDVDLDCPEALRLADRFLPETAAVFGRASTPRAHRLYVCAAPPPTTRFRDVDGAVLVELHADGCQIVVPPSVHSSGELVCWHTAGEPVAVDAAALAQAVRRLAAATLLARHWPAPGSRHDCALALAGALVRAGWSIDETEHFVAAVADAAGDDETRDRVRTVASTAARLAAHQPATGLPRLAALIDPRVVEKVAAWLDLHAPRAATDAADDGAAGEGGAPGGKRGEKLALRLLARARERLTLFHAPDGTPYAGCGAETWPIPSRALTTWLAGLAYRELGTTLSSDTTREVAAVLAAAALHDGPEQPVFVRVAPLCSGSVSRSGRSGSVGRDRDPAAPADDATRHGGAGVAGVVIDLADTERHVVVVTADGWPVVPATAVAGEVRFLRPPGMRPLLLPAPGGSPAELAELWAFVNVPPSARPLVLAWLVMALMPAGPYPHLMLWGSRGSAKSTTARMLAALVDPRVPALGAEPQSVRDLMIAARGTWLLAFDNLSAIPPWLSDALCRLSTGGGFATRELYSDAEEVLFDAQRAVLSTGIAEYVTRPDLLDRTIAVELPPIPEEQRRAEAELWAAFAQARLRLFGALLSRLVGALRELPRTRLSRLPRMADFALVAAAAEQGAGEALAFLTAYESARAEAHLAAVEASAIGPALLAILERQERQGGFVGTARALLEALVSEEGERASRRPGFPGSPRGLAGELRRLAPALRALGWDIAWRRTGKAGARTLTIRRPPATPPPKPPVQPSAPSAEPGDRQPTVSQTGATVSQHRQVEPATDGSDDADGCTRPSGDDGAWPDERPRAVAAPTDEGEDEAGDDLAWLFGDRRDALPAGAMNGGDGERRCPACGVIWNPNICGSACPACARNDDHVGLAAQVLAARAAGHPRVVIGGVRAVAGPAGWCAFVRSAPPEALASARDALAPPRARGALQQQEQAGVLN